MDARTANTPRITLVGAGPGNPELITLKAVKALKAADVILYDALVNKSLLDYAKPGCELHYVGKRKGQHSLQQATINEMIVDKALVKGHVVRLKGGDPLVFGRACEELDIARKFNIETSIIPGISSYSGIAASCQIPITQRGVSSGFLVITATLSDKSLSQNLKWAAQTSVTTIILMGLHKLKKIVAEFQKQGKHNLPIAIIQNGTQDEEKFCLGTVDTIVELKKEQDIASPALIIAGEVLAHSFDLQIQALQEIMCNKSN